MHPLPVKGYWQSHLFQPIWYMLNMVDFSEKLYIEDISGESGAWIETTKSNKRYQTWDFSSFCYFLPVNSKVRKVQQQWHIVFPKDLTIHLYYQVLLAMLESTRGQQWSCLGIRLTLLVVGIYELPTSPRLLKIFTSFTYLDAETKCNIFPTSAPGG